MEIVKNDFSTKEIEQLSKELSNMILFYDLNHSKVLELSRKLDLLIVEAIKNRKALQDKSNEGA